jgi:hypothetical protein
MSIPPLREVRNRPIPTFEEWQTLRIIRLETLDGCIRRCRGGLSVPVEQRFGWSVRLEILNRDADRSLRARISVRGPDLVKPYVRNVRLVKQRHLRLV